MRHEFINGKIVKVLWEDSWHETIITNIGLQQRVAKLRAVIHGLRVRCSTKNYYYPDVLVYPKDKRNACFIENPLSITEAISPSTSTHNLCDKFIAYRKFASLEYYLVVEPDLCYVNLFSKDENGEWQSKIYTQLTDTVPLPKLQASLPVMDIYKGL